MRLHSHSVTATILSYVGNYHEIKMLLNLLSTNTRYYFDRQSMNMRDYFEPFTGLIEFGNEEVEWTHDYPSTEEVQKIVATTKLKAIHLKTRER